MNLIPTMTGSKMATTPKTTALEVREDSSLTDSPMDPKLGLPTDPRAKPLVFKAKVKSLIGMARPKVLPMVGYTRPEEAKNMAVLDKPQAH